MAEGGLWERAWEEYERRRRRRGFWTKKKVLAAALVAVILLGLAYQPMGRPLWLWLWYAIRSGDWRALMYALLGEWQLAEARALQIEEHVAKGKAEVLRVVVRGPEEAGRVVRELVERDPNCTLRFFLEWEEAERQLAGRFYDPERDTPYKWVASGNLVGANRTWDKTFLIFREPLPVWRGGRVLAIKFRVVGYCTPGIFSFYYILLRPAYLTGYNRSRLSSPQLVRVPVVKVGYSNAVPPEWNCTVSGHRDWEAMVGDKIIYLSGHAACKAFAPLRLGDTYTLKVPFAKHLRGCYVVGIRVDDVLIEVLEIGYARP